MSIQSDKAAQLASMEILDKLDDSMELINQLGVYLDIKNRGEGDNSWLVVAYNFILDARLEVMEIRKKENWT